jgi:hypothetical protein
MSPTCEYKGCKTRPNFNIIGEKNGKFCSKHKLQGMVDVEHEKCNFEGCMTRASFNKIGEKIGIYCNLHKLEGMINIKSLKCKSEGCNKQPKFNIKTEIVGLYCFDHKLQDMIDVVNKTCKIEGCRTRPTFNIKTENVGIYCSSHKLEGMINVVDKKCEYLGCTKQPTFNKKGQKKAKFCFDHKTNDMVDLKHKPCISDGCETRPTFNTRGQTKGIYCVEHKLEGMINVVDKKCNSEWCDITAIKKYNNYCLSCCIQVCPEIQVSRNYKTKERDVSDRIDSHFKEYTWVNDKVISGGCSKRRPDKLLDLNTHVIIVEVDENKHTSYDTTCENKRLMELSQDLGFRPIVFIRFNPDSYILNGKVVKSCWKVNKLGVMSVMKTKEKEWEERIKVLNNQIRYWIETISEKTIEIVELFY